jgi:predicted negative regulator of RcsB-dependent stress response
VAYDLEEQEKIASLKAWWDRYGNALTSVVLGVALAVAGYNVWGWYQRDKAAKAGALYDELTRAVTAKDAAHVRELTGMLLDKYPATAYAEMGALASAKANLDAGDAKTAKAQLQWTVDHAVDPEYRAIARIRLSGVLLDEGDFDGAMKQVTGSIAADLSPPFQASFADRRGDIDLAQNKPEEAKKEYTTALALLQSRTDGRGYANVVQLKLDGLMGGALAAAAPAPAAPVAAPTGTTPTPATTAPAPAKASSTGTKP